VDGLSQEDAVEAVKNWFLQNFEDPVHSTPHDSSEGGYLYIWGGPYEASDVLDAFYSGQTSPELIEAVLGELESESLEWVPNSGRRQPPEDWIDHDSTDDPYKIFMDSYHHTGDLLAEHGSNDGSHLVNRLLFAQQVTALEAYLGDTLFKAVNKDREAMKRLVTADKNLNALKFTLSDIAANPDIFSTTVTEYLRSLVFHDLERVDFLYRAVFGSGILKEDIDKGKLFAAVRYRHDCVHRNCLDKTGKRLTVFTKKYVQETADLMRAFVDRVEHGIHGEPPF
jgi:hypothetical protein